MKFKLSNFCILLLLFLSSANNVESEIKSKIIATVDNQIITSYELKNKIITNIILNNEQIKRVSESKSIDNSSATNELDYFPTSYSQALANLRIESMHEENL